MIQIQMNNVQATIGQTPDLKVLVFTDPDSKISVTVPMDRLTAVKFGQQLAGSLDLPVNGGSNGH